jgi:ribosomal protein L11 methyltransferase
VNLAELVLDIAPEQAEAIEEQLFALGAISVGLHDAGDEPLFEPPPGAHPLWSEIRLRALFRDPLQAELAAAALASDVPATALRAQVEPVDDQDWVRAGLAGLTRIHCGGPLWIVPSWEPLPPDPEGVFVHLDPGLAFGTGTHPTTAMCLAALALEPPRGAEVLDYGCGSGILAIAALKLGAARATAVDIDPQALLATTQNAERNGLGPERLSVRPIDPPPPAAAFDEILANILAGPLVELAPRLAGCARPGARLLLAGLLERQAEEVRDAYRPWFDLTVADTREGWVLLGGRRRAD